MITNCKCETDPTPCDVTIFERPNFFPRQLVTPEDLNQVQNYFRDRLRLHNRMLFGWGVVCGARVQRIEGEDRKVQISRGFIIGPYGDEIYIPHVHEIELEASAVSSACRQVVECPPGEESEDPRVFVAVRYTERKTRPVTVQPAGCGCRESECEYTRLQDCYEFQTLDVCPESHQRRDVSPDPFDVCNSPSRPCEPCPSDGWVVLAAVPVQRDGTIKDPKNEEFERVCGEIVCSRRIVRAPLSCFYVPSPPEEESE